MAAVLVFPLVDAGFNSGGGDIPDPNGDRFATGAGSGTHDHHRVGDLSGEVDSLPSIGQARNDSRIAKTGGEGANVRNRDVTRCVG